MLTVRTRLPVLVLLVVVLITSASLLTPRASGRTAGETPRAPAARPLDLRCGLTAERSVDPRVIAERGEVDVRATYRYQCPTGARKVHYFILVENSSELQREGRTGQALVAHVREGLREFVNQFDYTNGTQGGLMLYTRTWRVASDLRGADGKQLLINAINAFSANAGSSGAGVGGAINQATGLLTAADGAADAMNVLLIVQAGAPLTNPPEDIDAACQAAKDKGVIVALLTLDGVKQPLTTCAIPEWTRSSPRDDGDDVPDILPAMGNGLARGHNATKVEYCDTLTSMFELVKGSGAPRPPDSTVLDQMCWEDAAPPPADGYTVSYRLRAAENVVRVLESTSSESVVRITFVDGSTTELPLPVPDICIHAANQPEFCDTFGRAMTATASAATAHPTVAPSVTPTTRPGDVTPTGTEATPVDTLTPTTRPVDVTPTATQVPPMDTVTPTPTSVASPTQAVGGRVYLPLVLKRFALP